MHLATGVYNVDGSSTHPSFNMTTTRLLPVQRMSMTLMSVASGRTSFTVPRMVPGSISTPVPLRITGSLCRMISNGRSAFGVEVDALCGISAAERAVEGLLT